VFLEQAGATPAPPPEAGAEREYRIVSAERTSALENDLRAAAVEGYRVVGAGLGYMTVVLARERGTTPPPVDYRLVATIRIETGVQELTAAGAQGFRIVATSQNGPGAVFVMERHQGASERFEYRIAELQEATANRILVDADTEGYRVHRLLSDLVLLERQGTPISPSAASWAATR
jgi:hypothetical protein